MSDEESKVANWERRYKRVPYSVPVWVLARTPGNPLLESQISTAVCSDLSLGGARIYCHRELTATHFCVRFCAPNMMFLSQPSRIVRRVLVADDLWEYGIEFQEPLPTHVMDFAEYESRERARSLDVNMSAAIA